jgi:chromosome segregation ATPase
MSEKQVDHVDQVNKALSNLKMNPSQIQELEKQIEKLQTKIGAKNHEIKHLKKVNKELQKQLQESIDKHQNSYGPYGLSMENEGY